MHDLSIRFRLPKIEINSVTFSPLNVKITIRGSNLSKGWLLSLPEMKRIENIVRGAYEGYTINISAKRDQLHELGTEQAIAETIFETAASFLMPDDQFEIYAVEIEGFGKYGQYDCRFCPFDSMVDQLINPSIKNGIAGGFCNIDPRDEMNSKEYQEMVRKESTGTFQTQKHAAFNPDEARRLAFDRDHEDHLLQLNAEDSILFLDVSMKKDRVRLISYFVELDELYVIEQFTDATKDKFNFETIARAAILNIKRRIEENRVAESTVWFDPFHSYQLAQWLQQSGIRVHEIKFSNPIFGKLQAAIRLMDDKAKAKDAARPEDLSFRSCDFCFYPLQNKTPVFDDQLRGNLFCSRKCLEHYTNQHGIELRRVGDPILSNADRGNPLIVNRCPPAESSQGEKMLLDHIGKNVETIKEKLFSPEALEKTDFAPITKHLLSTVEVDAPPRQTIHIIAPDSQGCAALIQSLLLSHPFIVEIFVHEFNDEPEVMAQYKALMMLNAEFEPKNGFHGVSEPLHISEQFLIELKQRNQKLLAVYDPGNLGLFAPKSRDYFGQMRFDVIEAIAEFNPRIVEKRNKSPEQIEKNQLLKDVENSKETAAERGNVTASDVEKIAGKYSVVNEMRRPVDCFKCGKPAAILGVKTEQGMLCEGCAKQFDFGQHQTSEPETIAVNAPDPMFAGDVQEFIAEETERIENVELLPNVENSTMAETPPDQKIEVKDDAIYSGIINGAACPICKSEKAIPCEQDRVWFVFAVHSARIAACAKPNVGKTTMEDLPVIVGENLLKPPVVVGDLLDLPDVDEMKFRTIPAPDPNFNYTCEHCPAILQSCPHYRVENVKEADQIFFANNQVQNDIGAFRQFLNDEFGFTQYAISSMQLAALMLRAYKKQFGVIQVPEIGGFTHFVDNPEMFQSLINAVRCPFCEMPEGVECSSATEPIFSPMAAKVHCARKTAFDLFILTTNAQFAPIKILSEGARDTVIEKVSCNEPFCNASSGGFKNESQGESCVFSADQRPDQLSTIENGVHLSRWEKWRDL